MTSDGKNGMQIDYNALDLLGKVSSGGTTLVKYSYLADGTRTAALKPNGSGLVQRGSLTYRRGTNGSLSFEGADISGGRFTAGQVIWHVTDHLGSVVGILRSGSAYPFEYNTFGAYGTKTRAQLSAPFTPEASLRFAFTGKEDQSTEFNVPYTDFGARHYSPALTRWLTPDPLSEKYYGISPYAYCGGDPVNSIDPDGRDIKDKIVGTLIGVVTNLSPLLSPVRDSYSPNSSYDYNNALRNVDNAAAVVGAAMTGGGSAMVAAGTVAAEAGGVLALSGVGAPAGAVAATGGGATVAAGAATAAAGALLMANSLSNSSGGYDRGKKTGSSEVQSTSNQKPKSPGHMQKEVEKGRAPKDIESFHNRHSDSGQNHVHFKDGSAMNMDGTVHDGKQYYLNNKTKEYLKKKWMA